MKMLRNHFFIPTKIFFSSCCFNSAFVVLDRSVAFFTSQWRIMASKFSLTAIQVLVIFVFWGQIQNYMMRSNINILIVAMVEEKVSKNGYENLTCWDNRVSQVSDVRQSENKESVESVKFDWGPFCLSPSYNLFIKGISSDIRWEILFWLSKQLKSGVKLFRKFWRITIFATYHENAGWERSDFGLWSCRPVHNDLSHIP